MSRRVLGVRAAVVILSAAFAFATGVGWILGSNLKDPLARKANAGLSMWLGDSVFFESSKPATVEVALRHLSKPAVIFALRDSCTICMAEFELVEAVARKDGMQTWMIVISDRVDAWEPMGLELGIPPGRVTRATAEGWGIKDTPAVIELGLGNRLQFFRQGAGAPLEFKAVKWHPADTTTSEDG